MSGVVFCVFSSLVSLVLLTRVGARYPSLKLAELTEKDLPAWVTEEHARIYAPLKKKDQPPPEPGAQDRLYFKLERRKLIKAANEKKGLGL